MKKIIKMSLFLVMLVPKAYCEEAEQIPAGEEMPGEQKTAPVSVSDPVAEYSMRAYKKIEQKLRSENWKERKSAVEGIPDTDVENKTDLIRIVLSSDKKYNVRIAAVKALIKIGGSDVIAPLTEALKDDKEYIRSTALGGLIGFGDEAADSIGSALKDQDEKIRKTAVEAISIMKKDIALKYLDVALSDKLTDIREVAINDIYSIYGSTPGGFNGPFIARLLGKSINDDKRALRVKAVEYISSIGGAEAIEVLYKGLEHPDSETRMAVVNAFGKIGGARVVASLTKSLSDDDVNIRMAGVNILIKIETPMSLKVFASAIADKEYRIRKKVVNLLAVRGDETVVEELGKALSDKNWDIRLSAVYALGIIGNKKAVDYLCEAIRDRDEEVQKAAINALKILKSKRCVRKLGKFLVEDKYLRKEVASTLGVIKDRRALKYLLEVLPKEKDEEKEAIEGAIIKIISVEKEKK